MDQAVAGYQLPLLLFAGFRRLIDDLHTRLAEQGHPDVRPAHGFALQAITSQGATAAEVGRRLGVSKQAAGKTIDRLEALGYVSRTADPGDARRRTVRVTDRGREVLRLSATIFDALRAAWAQQLGPTAVDQLEASLRKILGAGAFRLDTVGWLGSV